MDRISTAGVRVNRPRGLVDPGPWRWESPPSDPRNLTFTTCPAETRRAPHTTTGHLPIGGPPDDLSRN